MVSNRIVLFSGYSKLPSGTTSSEVYKVMGLVVLLDLDRGEIVEAECTLSTRLSEKFVRELLVGQNLRQGIDEILKRVNDVYQGNAKKAITTALRIIYDKYQSYLQHENIKA